MDNSYLHETGELLGYCSIVPKYGEEHRFGDTDVKFIYEKDGELYFTKEPVIDEDEEAEFIQNYLIKCGSFINTEDIKLVIEAQMEYLKSIGIVE